MRSFIRRHRTGFPLACGMVILFLLAAWYIFIGSTVDNTKQPFLANLYASFAGMAAGGVISILVLYFSFAGQKGIRTDAVQGKRILFLRKQSENLKEKYVKYVDTLGLGNIYTIILGGKSWKGLDQSNWPEIQTIEGIQYNIETQDIQTNNFIVIQPIKNSYDELQKAMTEVIEMTGTEIFEGEEQFAENAIYEGYFNVNKLASKLILPAIPQNIPLPNYLNTIHNDIKDAATSAGKVLIDICKLAEIVKREPKKK